MRLLTTGDERLREEAADGLATEKAQVALPLAEAEQLVRPWRSQPLERDRQRVLIELLANRRRWERLRSQPVVRAPPRIGMPSAVVVRSQPSGLHVIG